MDQNDKKIRKELKLGGFFFGIFAFLILFGIYVKRGLGHPELMMMFHAPAAVFLVLAGRKFMTRLKMQYESDE